LSTLSDDAWLDLLRSASEGQHVQINGRLLPHLPDKDIQIGTVGQAGFGAILEAWGFAAQCLARFRTSPLFADPQKILVDFGTGWGRIARCFLRDLPAENIVGVDVSPDLIAIARDTFPGPRFLRSNAMPPLAFQAGTVDFIVGYSVFSHLSEASCRAWIGEFARILKPGGMVAVTTRGRWFFDYAAGLTGADSYSRSLSRMFPDFEVAKARYDRGEFVHSNAEGVSGGGALGPEYYGETFIPERFAREELGGVLSLVEFYTDDGHPILFFQKPVGAQ
jgi:SAM-dependent methyltransferase